TPVGNKIFSSPVITWDRKIYIACLDHNLYKLDENGEILWRFTTGGEIYSSPALWDGRLYIGSYDHFLYVLGEIELLE
ncbi:MAG: PQQ-binding-like beta-propeller repeat protein, partial [Candidatus Eremiobacteraeota bacterium]|nr:PQQ-binding-like beta-propeller repeat protein [Candidatus Eremiobacteraeota bacterium]